MSTEPSNQTRPGIAVMIGDPNGIGPEVIVKAWTTGMAQKVCKPVLVGSKEAVVGGVNICGLDVEVRVVDGIGDLVGDPRVIEVLDSGKLDPAEIRPGQVSEACGRACAEWLQEADQLARDGQVAASIMGPINVESMSMAGVLDSVISPEIGRSYLFLITGPLRVVHLTDHISLRDVCDAITSELVLRCLLKVDADLRSWGVDAPRIGVAGLNPHAKGPEDEEQIAPGIALAREEGVDATGPVSPDTVFRQCVDGMYDAVLAMYHDQGHIAVKTWGFSGNCVIVLGPPYLHMSVAHGTAYDIAGRGIADPEMMLAAMRMAGSIASGRGFLPIEYSQPESGVRSELHRHVG